MTLSFTVFLLVIPLSFTVYEICNIASFETLLLFIIMPWLLECFFLQQRFVFLCLLVVIMFQVLLHVDFLSAHGPSRSASLNSAINALTF